jgi:hypothetical protein
VRIRAIPHELAILLRVDDESGAQRLRRRSMKVAFAAAAVGLIALLALIAILIYWYGTSLSHTH